MDMHRPLLSAVTALLLAGCSGAPEQLLQPVARDETPRAGSTVGGDGSQVTLAPLTAMDIESAELAGELACSFSMPANGTLLLARGDVASAEPSRGVVKVGDYVEMVAAPGGFDAMLRGIRFSGKGKTVTITLTGSATGGGESPPNPATLTYDRADGARRVFAGQWQCGP